MKFFLEKFQGLTEEQIAAIQKKYIAISAISLFTATIIYIIITLFHSTSIVWVTDFRSFYTAGYMLLHGEGKTLYSVDRQFYWQHALVPFLSDKSSVLGFFNPPFIALIFLPFALFPMHIAFILWGICNIIMLIGICFIAFLLFKKLTWQLKYLLIGGLLTFAPVWSTIMMGELSFILTLSIVLGWLFLRKNEDFYGGLILSLLLVKPHYIILPAIVLAWKKPKAFLGLLVGAFTLLLISIFAVGLTGLISYLYLLLSLSNWGEGNIIYPYIENSWYGLVYTYFHTIPSIGIDIYVFGVLIAIGVLLYVWSGRIKMSIPSIYNGRYYSYR